ncbi:MAG: GNAT family N-acetyltransferase [Pseudomonadota bacterium]
MITEPSLRRAINEDAALIAPLYADFFAEDGIETPDREIEENLAAMLADPRAAVFVAEASGRPVGLVSATTSIGVEFGLSAEIEDLFMLPAYRGHGIARQLFEQAMAWCMAEGAREIVLVITPLAEQAQGLTQLYEKFGFRRSGRIMMYRSGSGAAR